MDRMVGVIRTRDLLSAILTTVRSTPRSHLMDAPVIHEHANALKVLSTLRESDVPLHSFMTSMAVLKVSWTAGRHIGGDRRGLSS